MKRRFSAYALEVFIEREPPRQESGSNEAATQRRRALARWENEGGAPADRPFALLVLPEAIDSIGR